MLSLIKTTYKTLLNKGWALSQIDEADIFFLFDVLFGDEENQEDQVVYIDQVPGL
jgi:hypothetical protein